MPLATNPDTGETIFLSSEGKWEPAKTAVNPSTKEMLAYDGSAWTPVPAKSKGVLGYVDDAVRAIASGVTFGFMDEIAAKADEVTGRGGTYDENLVKERAKDAAIPTAIKIPGEIAGSVASTVLAAPAVGAAAVASGVAKLPKFAQFAGLGAAEGALSGAGNAEEGQRLSGANTGAAVGTVVGAAAPKIMEAGSSVVRSVKNAVSPEANVAADLGRAILRDGDTPATLAARATALEAERPGATMLADAGGENVRGLVERVAQTPGAGRTQVVPALTERQQAQAGRIARDLRDLTDTRRTATQAIEETMAARKTAAAPLYKEAMEFDASAAPEIVDAFKAATATGWGKSVLNSPDLKKTLQTEFGIKSVKDAPLMTLIDAWKKASDDIVSEAVRSGNNNKARVLGGMLDDVLGAVDTANPAYAKARNAWAGPSKFLDAIEDGRNILSTKIGAEELTGKFGAMTEAQQEAYRVGAVSSIIGKMGNDGAKLGDMTKYLRSPEVRAKVAAIMPSPEIAEKWAKRLDFEVSASELTGKSLGNSATARRLAERQDAENLAGDLVMDAITGGAGSIWKKVVMAGPKWLRDTMRSKADSKLADVLTTHQDTAKLSGILERAKTAGTKEPVSDQTNALAIAGGATGADALINR